MEDSKTSIQTNVQPKQKRFKEKLKQFNRDFFQYPLHLLSHPIAGWEDFTEGKMSVSLIYFVLMMFAVVIQKVGTGFLVTDTTTKDFNIFFTVSIVIFPLLIGTIANWCVTALFDGKGTMKKIFMTLCYSFFPFVWLSLLGTIFSNFVIMDEIPYVTFINTFAVILMGYMMFFGLRGIHEYGLFKNIITIVFTIVAIAIIIFLVLLFLSFIQQMYQWVASIIREIRMRYF
jgi:hypothetical protein